MIFKLISPPSYTIFICYLFLSVSPTKFITSSFSFSIATIFTSSSFKYSHHIYPLPTKLPPLFTLFLTNFHIYTLLLTKLHQIYLFLTKQPNIYPLLSLISTNVTSSFAQIYTIFPDIFFLLTRHFLFLKVYDIFLFLLIHLPFSIPNIYLFLFLTKSPKFTYSFTKQHDIYLFFSLSSTKFTYSSPSNTTFTSSSLRYMIFKLSPIYYIFTLFLTFFLFQIYTLSSPSNSDIYPLSSLTPPKFTLFLTKQHDIYLFSFIKLPLPFFTLLPLTKQHDIYLSSLRYMTFKLFLTKLHHIYTLPHQAPPNLHLTIPHKQHDIYPLLFKLHQIYIIPHQATRYLPSSSLRYMTFKLFLTKLHHIYTLPHQAPPNLHYSSPSNTTFTLFFIKSYLHSSSLSSPIYIILTKQHDPFFFIKLHQIYIYSHQATRHLPSSSLRYMTFKFFLTKLHHIYTLPFPPKFTLFHQATRHLPSSSLRYMTFPFLTTTPYLHSSSPSSTLIYVILTKQHLHLLLFFIKYSLIYLPHFCLLSPSSTQFTFFLLSNTTFTSSLPFNNIYLLSFCLSYLPHPFLLYLLCYLILCLSPNIFYLFLLPFSIPNILTLFFCLLYSLICFFIPHQATRYLPLPFLKYSPNIYLFLCLLYSPNKFTSILCLLVYPNIYLFLCIKYSPNMLPLPLPFSIDSFAFLFLSSFAFYIALICYLLPLPFIALICYLFLLPRHYSLISSSSFCILYSLIFTSSFHLLNSLLPSSSFIIPLILCLLV
ncbi:unnamed protein product [Acanthosepion pharaonis]|uniref:Uncharacterized protein n=1 Tax=Acanthosepion pharaonis TaxID=158019 RepID=A0A812E4Z0_ACAPH|nr:unnamed protein product [Sepia pharaonis]